MASDHPEIDALVEAIRKKNDCVVRPPAGLPTPRADHQVPGDLLHFYNRCGGCILWSSAPYSVEIVAPGGVARSNPEIIGEEAPDDITDSWYIIGRSSSGEAISIDLASSRLGKCYDSFWDRHGVPGSCPVIARSFTELLRHLLDARGEHWYWLRPDFTPLGDAYAEQ
ncbi:MAG TPA: SMI1/KNR4 family protein [Archangium sp.]|uniref:SMI1/KNR4 family protein n=1 Tax=Archangium sp. TaxID=1872627 RepID=UPI002E330A0B|nr:SMI1/KNR4 family protein [Archangium sp.]HEX5745172.1 SMI1/KNR4 family protein [Archangium sp.]